MKIKRSILVFVLLTTTVIIATITIHNYSNYDPQSECELIEDKTIYLAIDETIDIEGAILNKDEEILKLVENKIKAIKKGTTTVKANCTTYNVIVSDLYTLPIIDNDKQFLPCNYFSKQDNIFFR